MAKRPHWYKRLNDIDSCNVEFCEILTSSYGLEDFFSNEPYLVSIFKNYRSKKLNDLTLFWCFIISFMHWSGETKLYDSEKMDYVNLKLFGILRGNSVSNKSSYIKLIREAFDFVEIYFREMFIDSNSNFNSTCVESLTSTKLLAELEISSKFVSSDEDRPLNDFCFFEPNSSKAKEIHPSLISAFNGVYKLQRSTMSYSKDVCMNVLSTGSLGNEILYMRVHHLIKKLPSLEYLYITRLLIGTRVYKYDKEALDYLQPVLQNMRANRESFQGLLNSCQNKRAEACQRRGADIIERMSVIFQNLFDTLKVLQSIESIQFDRIRKNTLEEIKTKINNVFYSNEIIEGDDDCIYPDGVDLKELIEVQIKSVKKIPLQSMKFGISAAKAAVKFFKKVLLPQSIQLFSVDMVDVKKDIVSELKVIQNPMNCFSVGTRLLDSWMKILPNPANDQEIYCFRNELNKSYQIELEKYISLYQSGIDHKSSLTETSESILLTQRRWIEQLRWKLGNSAIQPNSSELIMVTHSPEKQMAQTERSASFESSITFNVYNTYGSISTRLDMFQDIIHCFAHSPMDSQTTYVNINESLSASQCMNYSRIIECCDDMVVENNEHILEDNHIDIDEYIIHDCLSDLTAQVDNLIKTTDEEIADLNSNQNFSSLESSKQLTASNDSLMSEGMKMLCKRILLTDSVILSSTKLNKICKTNMIDVRKACNLLIEHGLLSLENKLLANKFTYHESYMKQLPRNKDVGYLRSGFEYF
ncbi:unnamed protein product [Rotaria magnacalcarata]|uniref:Uncharacterized protein n=1 Tax=Rotaria magnacalcarata TaxID=392030 RepID=A0A820C802_9BILA|nr:unnamed protein product [Rotaria magnacalcarata]